MTIKHIIRNKVFDVNRALCTIYIACFWHLHNYLHIKLNDEILKYCNACTIIVLGSFTFMSGYFLKKYQIKSWLDIKQFFYKRIKRFYLPYIICLLILFFGNWFTNERQFILSAIGLSTYTHPLPKTIWYFSMIISFYTITPLLLYIKNIANKFYVILLLICIISLFVVFGGINGLYFPFYILGLFITDKILRQICNFKWIIFFITVLILLLLHFDNCDHCLILCGIFPLVKLSDIILKISPYEFWNKISYASMIAYLYHRIHYKLISEIICTETLYGSILFIILGCTTLFIISFYIQKFYEHMLNIISHQNT